MVDGQLRDTEVVQDYPAPAPGSAAFDPRRLWAIFMRRLSLFAPITGVIFVGVVLLALQKVPTYSSTASILIDPQRHNILDAQAAAQGMPADNNAIDTEVSMMSSQALAERVTRQLGLYLDPEFMPAPKKRGGLRQLMMNPAGALKASRPETRQAAPTPTAPGEISQAAVTNVLSHVLIRRAGLTYVINITASSVEPEKAARIANAFATGFIQSQLDAKQDTNRAANGSLTDQLTKLQNDVQTADAAVQNYKIAHNLMSASGGTIAEQEVSAINQQIASASAERAEKEARLSAARSQIGRGGGGADVGAALGSTTISQLRAQEADASRNLAELNTRYGDKYPAVQKARGQLDDIHAQIQQEINRIISSLEADAQVARQREASLKESLGTARSSLASNSSAQTGLLELQRRADAARTIYEGVLGRTKETSAQASLQQPDARVVAQAEPAGWPSSPNLKLAVMFAVVAGLGAGLAAVVVAEVLDSSVQTGADVERRFGVHYAGSVPSLKSTGKGLSDKTPPQDYMIDHPFSTYAESLRSLRAYLMLHGGKAAGGKGVTGKSGPPQMIAITSALPGEGKSLTSFCMARTLAVAGSSVVLVDCDLRRRGSSSYARARRAGLIEVLSGQASLEEALVKDDRSDAWMLPALNAPQSAMDMFATPEMEHLIAKLRARFDFVLLDTPPVLAVADTRLLASKADAVLMLVQWRRTPFKAADTAIDLLLEAGANVAGVALSRVNLRQQVRSGYGDRDYYYKAVRSYYAD